MASSEYQTDLSRLIFGMVDTEIQNFFGRRVMAAMIEPTENTSCGEFFFRFEIPEGKKIRDFGEMESLFDCFCEFGAETTLNGNVVEIDMSCESVTAEEAKQAAIEGFNEQLVDE